MVIFKDLSMRPKTEVDEIRYGIIMDEDEEMVFDLAIRNKSAQEMSFAIHKSPRTIYRIMNKVQLKILNYYEYRQMYEQFNNGVM